MANPQPTSILIVAGEASGDLHGAALVEEILKRASSCKLWGIGGSAMNTTGMNLIAHSSELSVTGLFEVLSKLKKILFLFSRLLKQVDLQKPDLAILIDYPDFNLRLARKLRQKGVPVLYYISPQVWAWRKRRVHFIRKWISKMLVVFPFEVSFYKNFGVDVDFVGHPLLDHMETVLKNEKENFGLDPTKKTIGLLPGSRKNELHYLLRPMIEAALKIHRKDPRTQFLLPIAQMVSLEEVRQILKGVSVPIRCIQDKFYEVLKSCDVVMCCSGTATLETALFGKPMVILYKLNWMSHVLGWFFVRGLHYFGMPNIILGKKVVPELLQSQVTGENIAKEVLNYLNSPQLYQKTSEELLQVREKLGTRGATQRAVDKVFELLHKEPKENNQKILNKISVFNALQTRYRFPLRGNRARARARSFVTSFLRPCPLALRDGLQGIKNRNFTQYSSFPYSQFLYVLYKIFMPFLWLASVAYGAGLEVRKFLYRIGIFKIRSVSAKVISIGNIAMGGTGKTPLTMVVAQELAKQGKKVVILSRGYKRTRRKSWDCVSEGQGPLLSPQEAGDEPWLMASKLSGIPIYVGGNRYEVAQEVLRQRPVDVFLLDDGFQHWGLERNLDIVTLDVTRFQKNKALLPLGFFREPLKGLKRAQCFVLVRTADLESSETEEIKQRLQRLHPNAFILEANYQPHSLRHVVSQDILPIGNLSHKKVFAFAGIGNPHSFKKMIQELQAQVVGFQAYLDHWRYSAADIQRLIRKFREVQADVLLTTEKDAVRLSHTSFKETFRDVPIYVLSVNLKMTHGESFFPQLLQTV